LQWDDSSSWAKQRPHPSGENTTLFDALVRDRSMSGPGGARVAVPRASIDPPVIEIVPIAIYL
jgi:hypothetical protein